MTVTTTDKSGVEKWSEITNMIESHVSRGKGISNALVERLCKKFCSNDFKGVYAANKLPIALASVGRFSIIVNLGEVEGDDTTLPVGHFVCITAEPNSISYIDPYGLPCIQPKVLHFLRESRRPMWENVRQIQHFDSPYCGLYSILFTVYFDKDAKRWLRMNFSKRDLRQNDRRCVNYLERLAEIA